MLTAHGKTLFAHAVESFLNYFENEHFIFIVRDVYETPAFVENQVKLLGIKSFNIVELHEETRGQAETVTLGITEWKKKSRFSGDCPITIFNIDTFRPNFVYPDLTQLSDGFLEVFKGTGSNWSFAKSASDNSTVVIQTAEKKAISDLCCTGLYHFKSMDDYFSAYYDYISKPKDEWEQGELYVAPLYNNLLQKGKIIHYNLIPRESVIFCGVPEEYEEFCNKND
ncbi:capsular biosynthesis protein [Pseudoalteromonas xiamenensis]|uniref:capsular biosynthesis protein n=1 Tax=Pseudoalteromonas xiamenensis TaxID=882626 RepID=UPI001FCA713C|nr:capsular biosynthesis protein [Pseudoalteromonas xiamenensis]